MLLVLPDSAEIAQKTILFVTFNVLDHRQNYLHTGCWRAGLSSGESGVK